MQARKVADGTPLPGDEIAVSASSIAPPSITPGSVNNDRVPHEHISLGKPGRDLNMRKFRKGKIRRPGRREWFGLQAHPSFTTRMVVDDSGMNDVYHWVSPELRDEIESELGDFLVVPYYSFKVKEWQLWPIRISDTEWYTSLETLVLAPSKEYEGKKFRVYSDKLSGKYGIKEGDASEPIPPMPKSLEEMLNDAVKMIRDSDHAFYKALVEGVDRE